MIELVSLSKQQKNRKAIEIKNKFLKQTHEEQLAETLKPITKKLEQLKLPEDENEEKNNQQLVTVEDTSDKSKDETVDIVPFIGAVNKSNLLG